MKLGHAMRYSNRKATIAGCATVAVASLTVCGGILISSTIDPASAIQRSDNTKVITDVDSVIGVTAPQTGIIKENPDDPDHATDPITPTSDGTIATYKENVVVDTNNYTGYKLLMSMSNDSPNNKLNHSLDSRYHIDSLDVGDPIALADLPANHWGYSLDGVGYKALPAKDDTANVQEQHLLKETTTMAVQDTTTVHFATKVNLAQAAGAYNNTVLYSVVAKEAPRPTATSISPQWLPVGNSDTHQITITGTRFTDAYSIQIGDAQCTNINVKSDTELTCDLGPSQTMIDETTTFAKAGIGDTMQSMTSTIANNVSSPIDKTVDIDINGNVTPQDVHYYQEATLKDTRGDGKGGEQTYTVAKLKDNKVWMTENLNLFLTNGNPLTSDNTNLTDGDTSWNPAATTLTDVTQYDSRTYAPRSYTPGEEYYYTSGTTGNDIRYTSLTACINAGHSAGDCKHHSTGVYYNWTASVAKNDTDPSHSGVDPGYGTVNFNAPNSICPKGWRLLKGNAEGTTDLSEFSKMLYAQGITQSDGASYTDGGFNNLRTAPLYWVRAGFIYEGESHRDYTGLYGFYWSSTVAPGGDAYYARFYYSGVFSRGSDYRSSATPLRCIATNTANPQPTPTPDPTPSNDANDSDNSGALRSAAPAASGASGATGATDDAAYSAPQGVRDTSLKHFISTGGPNWFLFILLLVLSVLTLGISLFIFWRKNRKENQSNTVV